MGQDGDRLMLLWQGLHWLSRESEWWSSGLRLHLPTQEVQRARIPHASQPKNQNIKQKEYCERFNKDFKKLSTSRKKILKKKKKPVWVNHVAQPISQSTKGCGTCLENTKSRFELSFYGYSQPLSTVSSAIRRKRAPEGLRRGPLCIRRGRLLWEGEVQLASLGQCRQLWQRAAERFPASRVTLSNSNVNFQWTLGNHYPYSWFSQTRNPLPLSSHNAAAPILNIYYDATHSVS